MTPDTTLTERWWWLAGSLGLAAIVGIVRWVLDEPDATHTSPVDALLPTWLYHTLRLLYAVGIPAAALLWRGALTTRGLGLQPFHWFATEASAAVNWTDWMRDLGWAGALTAGTYLIFNAAQRLTHHYAPTPTRRQRDGGIALREAVYHQAHWAFYREPFILHWGLQWGAWGGLLPVVLEALLNPERWRDLRIPQRGNNLLLRVGLAVLSVLLYIQTQNLWVLIVTDALLGWLVGHYTTEASTAPATSQ